MHINKLYIVCITYKRTAAMKLDLEFLSNDNGSGSNNNGSKSKIMQSMIMDPTIMNDN